MLFHIHIMHLHICIYNNDDDDGDYINKINNNECFINNILQC